MNAQIEQLLTKQAMLIEQIQKLLESQQQTGGSTSHPAAQIIFAIVPLLGVIFGVSFLFFYFRWRHRLHVEMVKSGQHKPTTGRNFRALCLLLGTVSTAVGLPMTFLFWAVNGLSLSLLGGLMPLAAGIGLILFVYLSRDIMTD